MRGYEIVARSIARSGIDTLFGLAGDANLYIIDELIRSHGVRYAPAAHEAAATMMAIGYARAGDRVGAATTTHGPALTNTVTALVEGVRSGTPIVLFAGDTDAADPDHPQNVDQRAVVAAAGAGFEPLRSLRHAAADVGRAVWRAKVESRPIVVNMPSQLQWAEGECEDVTISWPDPQAIGPDPAALDKALGILASANRPIVLAGRGARHAREPLSRLAERLGAPLATTLLGAGLFRGEPFDLGVFGTVSHPVAAETIMHSDCVISFGASLNKYTTDAGRLLAGKRLVQCDISPTRFGRHPRIDAAVIGDAAAVADTMVRWLEDAGHRPGGARSQELADRLAARAWVGDHSDRGTDETIDPRTFTAALDRALPADRTVAIDVGRFMLWGFTLPVPEPTALVTTNGFQSVGLGSAAAVGAAIARPDRPVVLLAGDGGFMMGGMAEFQAAVRLGVDLVAVIYNDGSYGAEHVQFHRKGLDPRTSLNDWPDFAAVAAALGGHGMTVRSNKDLDAMADAIAGRRRPLLVDVHLDPVMLSELLG